jgi:hypothetical protein
MPRRRPKLKFSTLLALTNPEISAKLVEACDPAHLKRVRADAKSFASRIFSNALINHAWRHGPVDR